MLSSASTFTCCHQLFPSKVKGLAESCERLTIDALSTSRSAELNLIESPEIWSLLLCHLRSNWHKRRDDMGGMLLSMKEIVLGYDQCPTHQDALSSMHIPAGVTPDQAHFISGLIIFVASYVV